MTAATGPTITVISFGYLHGAPPVDAHLTIDLRHHFRDPHVSPELRYMTAHDAPVRAAVMNTPGIKQLLAATVAAVDGFLAGPSSTSLTIATSNATPSPQRSSGCSTAVQPGPPGLSPRCNSPPRRASSAGSSRTSTLT